MHQIRILENVRHHRDVFDLKDSFANGGEDLSVGRAQDCKGLLVRS
jgi:hypothetical protein